MNTDNIKGAAKKIEGSVESAYGQATGSASAQFKGESDKAQGKILNAFGKVEDAVSNFANSAADEAKNLKGRVVENPLQSAGIALVAGFILGRLFR